MITLCFIPNVRPSEDDVSFSFFPVLARFTWWSTAQRTGVQRARPQEGLG